MHILLDHLDVCEKGSEVVKIAVEAIGSITIALIIVGIPITTGLSFGFGWHAFIKFILTVTTLLEFICLSSIIFDKQEKADISIQI